MKHKVFVYGTLRKNLGWNHLLKNSEFLGEATTKELYAMYADTIPYVIESEKVSQIKGELYLVDDITLEVLDKLEGHPYWYCRKKIKIIENITKNVNISWIYFNNNVQGKLVESGDYQNFLLKKHKNSTNTKFKQKTLS